MWPCQFVPGFLPGTYSGSWCSHPGPCGPPAAPAPLWPPWYAWWYPPPPGAPKPPEGSAPPPAPPRFVPKEIEATTAAPAQEALVGGAGKTAITLEYLPDSGATAPSIKISITEEGTVSDSAVTVTGTAYSIKSGFTTVAPGAKIALKVEQCLARLRWFEQIS